MTPDEMLDAIDTQPVIKVLRIALVLLVLGFVVMIGEAQEGSCQPFDPAHIDADVTDDMMAIYGLQPDEAEQRYHDSYGQYQTGIRSHTYRQGDYWIYVIPMLGNQFFVYIGDDWTLGDDGLWHNPCRVLILDHFVLTGFEAVIQHTEKQD